MRISIGSDHRGTELKSALVALVESLGHKAFDEGPCGGESVDYPDIAAVTARRVSRGECDRGILICGTGIGMSITANKFLGVRAAVANEEATARLSRQHNDANILCLSGDLPLTGADQKIRQIESLVKTWLETPFEGGRHGRRVEKISEYEKAARECK